MQYDFDTVTDRHGTGSAKWDAGKMLIPMGITPRSDEDTLPMFTADMDFPSPPSVRQEIQKVVDHNLYGYTVVQPSINTAYFQAVCDWMQRRHNWQVQPQEIQYVDGTVTAVRYAVQAFSEPGDGVLINRPIYTPFTKLILGTGRQVVNSQLINTDGYYTIDFEDFERKAALPTTRCFILCNPHNPTGRIWSDDDLRRMYDICTRNGVVVISDEVHADLIRCDQAYRPIGALVDGQNLVVCTAPNKTFNIAALKVTNVIIKNPRLRARYFRQTGLIFTSPVSIAACIGAYNGGEEWLEQLKRYLDDTFDWVLGFCREHLPKMRCVRPEGTYILWMDFRGYGLSAEAIREKIYVGANVALESGALFDPDQGAGFERICLAAPRSVVQQAFRRIARQFEGL